MRGWWIPVVLRVAAACSSDDRTGPGIPPGRPGEPDAAPRSTAPSRSPGPTMPTRRIPTTSRTTASTAPPTTSTGPLRHQLAARGDHGGAGVRGRRAHQRCAALLHGDGGERGRVRERPLAAPGGHAAARHPERGAVRVPGPVGRAAASGSGTISTATAASRERSWASCASGSARGIDFVGRPRRIGRSVPHARARGDGRGVLRRERSGRGSHRRSTSPRTAPTARRASWPFPATATSSRWTAATASSATARVRVSHVGQDFLILDWAYQTDPGNPELIVRKR